MLGPFMQVVAALAEGLRFLWRRPQCVESWSRCAAASTAFVVRYVAAAGAGEGPGAVPGLRCHPSSSPRQRCVNIPGPNDMVYVNGVEPRKQRGSMGKLTLNLSSGYINRWRLKIISHTPGDLARIQLCDRGRR